MRTRSFPAAILALTLVPTLAAAQPQALRERFAERLQATSDGDMQAGGYGRMWSTLDSLVTGEMDRGQTIDGVNRTLASLPGFSGASEGDGVTVGGGTFYGALPRELPGYFVAPIRAGREALVIGIFNFGINEPGQVSLYARRAGHWQRTAMHASRFHVTPYLLPLADSGLAIVTLDLFAGADHQDGTVRVWRVRNGALLPLRTLAGEMKEPQAEVHEGRVRVAFTRFPQHLATSVLGTRLAFVSTIAPAGAGVSVSTEVQNPWVAEVDRYFGLVRANPAQARALLASPALAARLGTRPPPSFDDGGDLRAGTGWLDVERDGRRLRITSRRGGDGRWRITGVEPSPAPAP
jgi:hypothetical protein